MKEIQLTVRYYLHGEYENTCTMYIDIPEDTTTDKEMEVMMSALKLEMEGEFGYYQEWKDGDFTYTLTNWVNLDE